MIRIINQRNGLILAECATHANSFLTRLQGLLGKKALPPGQGLIISPSNWVHSLGMKFPIDVIYLSKKKEILYTQTLKRNKLTTPVRDSYYVLELPQGMIHATDSQVGDQLSFQAYNLSKPVNKWLATPPYSLMG
jgi:uncharacterized membrane protein (UPF0127 family)